MLRSVIVLMPPASIMTDARGMRKRRRVRFYAAVRRPRFVKCDRFDWSECINRPETSASREVAASGTDYPFATVRS
jgi:hypothetical protein